jgi:hypothetical protein
MFVTTLRRNSKIQSWYCRIASSERAWLVMALGGRTRAVPEDIAGDLHMLRVLDCGRLGRDVPERSLW